MHRKINIWLAETPRWSQWLARFDASNKTYGLTPEIVKKIIALIKGDE